MQALSTEQYMRMHFLSLVVAVLAVLLTAAFETNIDQSRYSEGKKQFELVEQKSQMPKYGQCWRQAMIVIQTGCRRLDDVVQTRLALSYLNCFLQIQGKVTYPCSEESELEVCVRDMNDADRSSFATFFAHTQDICYFLQAQVWQEQTQNTIGRLEDTSSQVAKQLESSHQLQQDMVSSQNLSLHNQERLMSQAQNLSDIINASSKNVHFLFEDLKKSTLEQRQIIGDLFDQLAKLQSTILGEISGFYSLFYYVLSVFVCYLLTSASRTSGARFWLFLIMTINVIVEQSVMRWISSSASLYSTDDVGNERLYWLQRQSRRATLVLALLVLGFCAYLYKDINTINNRLLVEIRRQNSDLWRFVTGNLETLTGHKTDFTSQGRQQAASTDSDYTSDNDVENNDGDSDKTFILSQSHEDTDSFRTLQDDDVSDVDHLSLLGELSDLQKVTDSSSLHVESWLERSYGGGEAETSSTPVSGGSPYNLRPRKSGYGGNISPAAQVESARSFSRTVHQMQEIAEKNSRLIRAMQQHGHQTSATENNHVTTARSALHSGAARVRPFYMDGADRSSMFTRSSRASSRKQ